MLNFILPAARMLAFMTFLTGILYPALLLGVAQVVFKESAEGSLIQREGKIIGSVLIAQKFSQAKYFWPRPSAVDYNPLASGGSNLSPDSQTLQTQVAARSSQWSASGLSVPADLLFTSASGLDPEISPQAARFQVARVAQARGLDPHKLQLIVEQWTQGRQLGILGERRVNVLQLNLALDQMSGP
jgi:K+-transporting ATPase ATPase C chain